MIENSRDLLRGVLDIARCFRVRDLRDMTSVCEEPWFAITGNR